MVYKPTNHNELKRILLEEFTFFVNDDNIRSCFYLTYDGADTAFINLVKDVLEGISDKESLKETTDIVFKEVIGAFNYHGSRIEEYYDEMRPQRFGTKNIRRHVQNRLAGLRIHIGNKYLV